MAGNELGEPGSNGIPPIERDELIEYSGRPNYRVRLFYKAKSSLEMAGDGFLRQDNERFYVLLDYPRGYPHYLKSGEIIGIQEEGKMGFEPRRLVI